MSFSDLIPHFILCLFLAYLRSDQKLSQTRERKLFFSPLEGAMICTNERAPDTDSSTDRETSFHRTMFSGDPNTVNDSLKNLLFQIQIVWKTINYYIVAVDFNI